MTLHATRVAKGICPQLRADRRAKANEGGPRAVSRETVNKSPLEFQLTSQLFLLLRFGPYCRSESEIAGSACAFSSSFKMSHLKRRRGGLKVSKATFACQNN